MFFCFCQIYSPIMSHFDTMHFGYSHPCPALSYLLLNTLSHLPFIHIYLLCCCLSVLSCDPRFNRFEFLRQDHTEAKAGLKIVIILLFQPPKAKIAGVCHPTLLEIFLDGYEKKKVSLQKASWAIFSKEHLKIDASYFQSLPSMSEGLRKTAHPLNNEQAVQLKSLHISWIH